MADDRVGEINGYPVFFFPEITEDYYLIPKKAVDDSDFELEN